MKEKLLAFIDSLILYDYILFGVAFALFILLLVLAVILRERIVLALLSILFAFSILLFAPTLGYVKLHEYLFKTELHVSKRKQLEFTDALLIEGALTNRSKFTFKRCVITAAAYKISGNRILDMLAPYVPFKKGKRILDTMIKPKQTVKFKLFIEPFRYKKDYNVTVKSECL